MTLPQIFFAVNFAQLQEEMLHGDKTSKISKYPLVWCLTLNHLLKKEIMLIFRALYYWSIAGFFIITNIKRINKIPYSTTINNNAKTLSKIFQPLFEWYKFILSSLLLTHEHTHTCNTYNTPDNRLANLQGSDKDK